MRYSLPEQYLHKDMNTYAKNMGTKPMDHKITKYEITIRHADGKDVNVLFEEERFKVEVLNTELQALQNAADSVKLPGLQVHAKIFEDKRKSNKYFLQYGNNTISPVLDYSNMNHFILGIIRAKDLITK